MPGTIIVKVCQKRNRRQEKKLVNECLRLLTLRGYVAIRTNSGMVLIQDGVRRRAVRMSAPGVSDIIACGPDGRFVAVECKVGNNKLTDAQKDFLNRIHERGGLALVVRKLDDLLEVINNDVKRKNN